MKDMINSSEEIQSLCTPKQHKEEYPYGLRLSLTPKEIKKLGLMKAPGIEDEFLMLAKVCVVSVDVSNDTHENDYSMSLQIKEMELKSKEKKQDDAVSTMYGDS